MFSPGRHSFIHLLIHLFILKIQRYLENLYVGAIFQGLKYKCEYNPYYIPSKRLEFRGETRETANVNYYGSIKERHLKYQAPSLAYIITIFTDTMGCGYH